MLYKVKIGDRVRNILNEKGTVIKLVKYSKKNLDKVSSIQVQYDNGQKGFGTLNVFNRE